IVAGSDHDAASRTKFFYVVRNGGRGCVVVSELDRDSGAGENLGCSARSAIGSVACVVSDEHSAIGILVFKNVSGNGACHATHVLECKVVGDEATPAVGAEFDFCHAVLGSRFSVTCGMVHVNFVNLFWSRCFTTFPTSCDFSSVMISRASSVS